MPLGPHAQRVNGQRHRPTHAQRVNGSNGVGHREASHTTVLLRESVVALDLQPDDVVIDATLGGGGHAKAILEKLGKGGVFIGIDADSAAVERSRAKFKEATATIYLHTANFRSLGEVVAAHHISHITKALFDLGWSSFQLAEGRGFSFLADEPLLMTYEASPGPETLTAERIVNTWKEESIADVIFGWGEERYSRQIARAIVRARASKPIRTSRELAEIIRAAVPAFYRKGRLHPATKTFQALRIAVNDEMGALKEGLSEAWRLLAPGGRLAAITFHSVEDREVKRLMKEWVTDGSGALLTKSPTRPSREEVLANPRARSAKLRVIEKIEQKN